MPTNKIIPFNYEWLVEEAKLYDYCRLTDFDLRKMNHSKTKNYVTNFVYMSEELTEKDKYVFLALLDFKSQQKFLYYLAISFKKLAGVLLMSVWKLRDSIKNLEKYNLIIQDTNAYGDKIIIINENILTWWIAIDKNKLGQIELFRKQLAGSNVQLIDWYNDYNSELNSSLPSTN